MIDRATKTPLPPKKNALQKLYIMKISNAPSYQWQAQERETLDIPVIFQTIDFFETIINFVKSNQSS